MSEITIKASKLPFALNGLVVRTGITALDRPLPPGAAVVFDVELTAGTKQAGKFATAAAAGGWTASLEPAGRVTIEAVWPNSAALVKKYDLKPLFAAQPAQVILLLTAHLGAEGKLSGKVAYGPATSTVTAEGNTNVTLTYARAYPAEIAAGPLLEAFLDHAHLPGSVHGPLASDELIAIEHGRALSLGATIGVGYTIAGTSSIDIGQLRLSERYQAGFAGTAGVAARVEGLFRVELRAAVDRSGRPIDGWTRTIVKKNRTANVAVEAGVSARVTAEVRGLPAAPHEFLGALLGLNVGNWLNLLDRVREFTSLDDLIAECDELALAFLTSWIDEQLDPRSLKTLIEKARAFTAAYGVLDLTVLTAFERFFQRLEGDADRSAVTTGLDRLVRLESWRDLEGDVDPLLWELASELTGGETLAWMAERPIGALQARAAALLELGDPAKHPDLHGLVRLVNQEFGLGPLFTAVAGIKTVADLKAQAGTKLDGFVQRLLGASVTRLKESDLGKALARLHGVLANVDRFEKTTYTALADAAKRACAIDLHTEYSRSSEDDALIDVAIDTSRPEGVALLEAATGGELTTVLNAPQQSLIRVNKGKLTHTLTRKRTLSVNVIGWHAGWRYQGMERLMLRTDQQIASDSRGGLTVHTTADLTREKTRRSAEERVSANFMMRFFGESAGLLRPDPKNLEYLIETISKISAAYRLNFEDEKTTVKELASYLSYANAFGPFQGLEAGDTDAIAAMFPRQGPDSFGRMTVTYEVRYEPDGLEKLFRQPLEEALIRRTIRQVTLASYLRTGGNLARLGWAYWSPATQAFIDRSATRSFAMLPATEIGVAPSPFSGIVAPMQVVLHGAQLETLNALYLIENAFVRGFLALEQVIAAGRPVSPRELERKLSDFATAFRLLDKFGESVNTMFAVFDALVKNVDGARASSLTIESQVNDKTITKRFLAWPAA
jgi:hypothetical protein